MMTVVEEVVPVSRTAIAQPAVDVSGSDGVVLRQLVGGRRVDGDGAELVDSNPARAAEIVAAGPLATAAPLDAVVAGARPARRDWADTPFAARAAVLDGAGARPVEHDGVDAVTLTGSTAVGRGAIERSGAPARPIQTETGGRNAAAVLSDADLDFAADHVLAGAFRNTGRKCTATLVLHVNSETAGADPRVPFGGAKAGGLGPKEQGRVAREFFTRATTGYRRAVPQ
jgi:acyl-CoA reductase-like NAD-dependent aldehyde dehydrogenase